MPNSPEKSERSAGRAGRPAPRGSIRTSAEPDTRGPSARAGPGGERPAPTRAAALTPDTLGRQSGGGGGGGGGPAFEAIQRRAYELYLERDGGPGSDMDDWLRAEQELRG